MYDPPMHPSKTVCINATTGETIWTLTGWTGRNCPIVADGHIILWNSQDAKIYSIGKGPTTTTVTAGPKVSKRGSTVLIEGTVMDVSAGSKQEGVVERFSNGLPAVDDSFMDEWMSYVYMQQNRPEDVTGVPMKLAYLLPDGTWKDIDEVISDDHGNFGFKWTPPGEGTYLVKAFFLGSESYWGSSATTYLSVDPAPEPYPDVPTAEEIAQKTVSQIPAYPVPPTADTIAQRTVSQMPAYPEMPDIPAYLTIDLAIIAAVVIAIIIGLYGIIKKQK